MGDRWAGTAVAMPRPAVGPMPACGAWRRRAAFLVVAALLLTAAAAPSPARASGAGSCSYGEAAAQFEAMPPLSTFKPREDPNDYPDCQFRLFLDGETVTFTDDDWFLAGAVDFVPYRALGISRSEAIALLDSVEARAWLAEVHDRVVGEPVEQTLNQRGNKGFHSPFFGLVVYRHYGYITRLPAGEYLSVLEVVVDGETIRFEVMVRILAAG